MSNTALTDQQNENSFLNLNMLERYEFIHKLIITAQHGYYGECSEVVNRAQRDGLFERIKPSFPTHEQIIDLDNPIHNNSTDL